MPTYKYNGNATFINSLYGLRVEPGEIIKTRYILDNVTGFERIDDEPPPYSDYSEDYILNPGEKVEIYDDAFEGLNTITAFKIDDESNNKSNVAILYIDQESDKTDNIIDNNSYVTISEPLYRGIKKLILKAGEDNNGTITIRVSFGYSPKV